MQLCGTSVGPALTSEIRRSHISAKVHCKLQTDSKFVWEGGMGNLSLRLVASLPFPPKEAASGEATRGRGTRTRTGDSIWPRRFGGYLFGKDIRPPLRSTHKSEQLHALKRFTLYPPCVCKSHGAWFSYQVFLSTFPNLSAIIP